MATNRPAQKKPAASAAKRKRASGVKPRHIPVDSPKRRSISMIARSKIMQAYSGLLHARQSFLSRRPHRSFTHSYRRDYARSLVMPGYIVFTAGITKICWRHKRTFFWLAIFYTVAMLLFGVVTSQQTYTQIGDKLVESNAQMGDAKLNTFGQAALLLASTITSANRNLSPEQQAGMTIIILFVWLTTVWLLREFLAGRNPTLRDGVYNAGAPIAGTVIIALTLTIQVSPLILMALLYTALLTPGMVNEGFGAMIFWLLAISISILVLYWITGTIIALITVTIPGMYPMQALRAAGDFVIGRRLRILLRILWAILVIVVAWVVIMVPLVIATTWLATVWVQVKEIPIIPASVALMTSFTTIWFATYVYVLYRKVIEDDAKPA